MQYFHVKLQCKKHAGVEYVRQDNANANDYVVSSWDNSEWHVVDTAVSTATGACYVDAYVSVRASRIVTSYIARILGVLGLILLLSLSIFVIDVEAYGDRLGNGFTILLTVTAYSLVTGDCLPSLGYLTFMDKCNLGGYAIVSMILFQITVIEALSIINPASWDSDAKFKLNNIFAVVDIGGIVLSTFYILYHVRFVIGPCEIVKLPDSPPSGDGVREPKPEPESATKCRWHDWHESPRLTRSSLYKVDDDDKVANRGLNKHSIVV